MKKWILGFVVLGVAILLGGWIYVDHANKETIYRNNLNSGNEALKNQNYNQAKRDFQTALSAKPDSHVANGSVSQVEKFMDGEKELQSNDFQAAKDSFKMAANSANGSKRLANQAQQKINLINTINNKIKQFNEVYKTAVEQHNAKDYALSNDTLNQILQDNQISHAYYEDVLAKAKDLKKSNDKSLNNANEPKRLQTKNDGSSVVSANNSVTSNGSSSDLSKYNVYSNPQEYANRFANSSDSSNTIDASNDNIANRRGNSNNDPYNVYTNPAEYANRFN